MNKIIFESNGSTASSISFDDYLRKGSVFEVCEIFNDVYLNNTKAIVPLTFSFRKTGIYTFNAFIEMGVQKTSWSSLLFTNFIMEKTLIKSQEEMVGMNISLPIKITDNSINTPFQFLTKGFGNLTHAKVSNISIFHQEFLE